VSRVAVAELRAMVQRALQSAGANEAMAVATARALVLAESQGLGSHGLSRVVQYATHLRNGRVNKDAYRGCLRGAVARCRSMPARAWPSPPEPP
jgi:(2R)-3-sulfolactate dehydrogenase (NADP+)